MSHVFLVGFMGSGKSSVGRLLAEKLGMPFCDLDAAIERRAGKAVSGIFASDGEVAFRQLEHEELSALTASADHVVACGGGVIVEDRNRALLKSLGTVVYLHVTADEAIMRIGSAEGRPLLAGDPLAASRVLLSARESLYEAVADVTIDTTGRSLAQVADAVVAAL
jgi:shikimate kinase